MPRIVLPVTSREIALTDRVCWGILAAAMVVAAGLILWLNRGTTFFIDELIFVYSSPHLSDASDVLRPYNGHLIATSRLVFKAMLETFGSGYLPFRLLAVGTVLLSAGLFYELVKRRIGALPALAPTLVLLFLGSDRQHVVDPIGFTIIFSVAAGLAALLALERGDRRGDLLACAFLLISVATYSTGLAFLVGVAISVLLRPDRRQRAWVFLVPLALYALWWLWALGAGGVDDQGTKLAGGALGEGNTAEQQTKLANVLLIPSYLAESLSVVTAALTGLDFNFVDGSQRVLDPGPGPILALAVTVALVVRIRRGRVHPSLWASIGIVLTYWVLGALAFSLLRPPFLARYIYMGAVGVLLVASDAGRSARFSKLGLGVLFAVASFSLATNLSLLRDAGSYFRNTYSIPVRAEFAALDIARGHVRGRFDPATAVPSAAPAHAPAATYLAVSDRYGPIGFTPSELERQSDDVRQGADQVLASALDLRLETGGRIPNPRSCRQLRRGGAGEGIAFTLPGPGATLQAEGTAAAELKLARFAIVPSASVGDLSPGETTRLRIPEDGSARPWRASLSGADSVRICPLG